jgi:Mg2+/citrate symporter
MDEEGTSMLSDSEQKALDDIERRLAAEDVTWSARFATGQPPPSERPLWFHYLLIATSALMAALTIIMVFAGVGFLAAVFACLAVVMAGVVHQPATMRDHHRSV